MSPSLSPALPGISTLIAKGVYDSAFPLHDVSVRFGIPTRHPLAAIYFTTAFNLQRMETGITASSRIDDIFVIQVPTGTFVFVAVWPEI